MIENNRQDIFLYKFQNLRKFEHKYVGLYDIKYHMPSSLTDYTFFGVGFYCLFFFTLVESRGDTQF